MRQNARLMVHIYIMQCPYVTMVLSAHMDSFNCGPKLFGGEGKLLHLNKSLTTIYIAFTLYFLFFFHGTGI
jgi:hypothetical protein